MPWFLLLEEDQEKDSEQDGSSLPWLFGNRILASSSSSSYEELDYTVLGVAVITLGLILVVEVIRHGLDVKAIGRPFFKSVLEGVYRELATLGVVEFFIFLLHKYYSRLNINQEQVFADIHFTLFFTAVFNAIMSVLLAVATTRISTKMWVQTEQLEVDHYVEIREEFERVKSLLYSNNKNEDNDGTDDDDNHVAEGALDLSWTGMTRTVGQIVKFLRYPLLYRKHQQLLVQIRFHELRVHFLQSQNLPLQFKVSAYLKRSELHLLIKLVHITSFAWLMLTGCVALVYFLMGIVVYVTNGDSQTVGASLTLIFVMTMIFYVVLSLILYNKMKHIFYIIMRKRLTVEELSTTLTVRSRHTPITSQTALFWGGNPKFIRVICQFMQFGFAIAFSFLLVFWKDIDDAAADEPLSAGILLAIVVSCYAGFLLIIPRVLPRYVLCTSLGQMVNKQVLQETLAEYRLEEAQRKKALQLKLLLEYDSDDSFVVYDDVDDDASKANVSVSKQQAAGPIMAARNMVASSLQRIVRSAPPLTTTTATTSDSSKCKTMEDIDFLPLSSSMDAKQVMPGSREERIRERRMRRKAASEGVAMMRTIGGSTGRLQSSQPFSAVTRKPTQSTVTTEQTVAAKSRRRNERQKSFSGPDQIMKMRRSESFETMLLTRMVQTDTKDLRKELAANTDREKQLREQREEILRARRRGRMKSVSDGVALMRAVVEEEKQEEKADGSLVANPPLPSTVAPTQVDRHDRRVSRRAVSASASIQQMREMREITPLSREEEAQTISAISRSDLEPVVEGVPVKHLDPTLDHMPSVDIGLDMDNDVESPMMPPMSMSFDEKSATEASTLGGHSDFDDIPDVHPGYVQDIKNAELVPNPSFREVLSAYYLSQRYQMISGVFGTLICFFLVGSRVESLMLATCTMPDYNNTWHIKLSSGFWMETGWLTCFIISSFITMYLFRPGHIFSNTERSLFCSGVADFLLSALCLALLMWAETFRCCAAGDEQRFLAPAGSVVGEYYNTCEVPSDCCPSFGLRWYGSLGNIEPFTALIALRIFRFALAEKIIAYLDKRFAWSATDIPRKTRTEVVHPFSPLFSVLDADAHHIKAMNDEAGTIVELWQRAINLYPGIVAEYGEFSGELLQAMLGIEGGERASKLEHSQQNHAFPIKVEQSPPRAAPKNKRTGVITERRASEAMGEKFSRLTPDAQSIILSSRLGKSVRSMSLVTSKETAPSMVPQEPMVERAVPPNNVEVPSHSRSFSDAPGVTFQVESFRSIESAKSKADQSGFLFVAPNARLIRSMRRCDRRLLPLLAKWTVVDVVMTKYEIVYLDASHIDDVQVDKCTEEEIRKVEAIRQAVIATKGGKRLSLRDVVAGRKVVGHLDISSIYEIHVERVMPSENGNNPAQPSSENDTDVQVEFWKKTDEKKRASNLPRASRWERIKQDRLRIHSVHGTLYLRFYSDLEDSEGHEVRCKNKDEADGPIIKDNAFQWCQSIGRLCGINQLKQNLPHFGDNDDAELRDYLVVVDSKYSIDSPRHMRKKTVGDLLGMAHLGYRSNDSLLDAPPPPLDGGRATSSGEQDTPNRLGRTSRILRRLASYGELPAGEANDVANLRLSTDPSRFRRRLASSGDVPTGEANDVANLRGSTEPSRFHRRSASSGDVPAGEANDAANLRGSNESSRFHRRLASSGDVPVGDANDVANLRGSNELSERMNQVLSGASGVDMV